MRVHMGRMTRIVAVAVLLVATLLGISVRSAQAQDTVFPAYTSGVQVANLSGTDVATISLNWVNPDGTSDFTMNDTINPGSSKTYLNIQGVTVGFSGSMVISSNQNIAAIANTVTPDFRYNSSYVGRSQGGQPLQIPLLAKNNSGYYSWFSLQNAGGGDANVQVTYSDGTNASGTIKPGAAKTFYQKSENHPNPVFSAIVTSNQPLVGAVIYERTDNLLAYTAFTGGATNPIFPLINANNNGIQTGIQIQNAGNQDTQVVVTYSPDTSIPGNAQNPCTETQTIQGGGKSATFALALFANGANGTCQPGAKFIGAARVTTNSTNQPLVAVVNQLYPPHLGSGSSSYVAFAPADAGEAVVLPLILDRNSGYFTGVSVANVGGSAVNVNCTFQSTGYTMSGNVQPGGALVGIQENKIANKYVGSGVCSGGAGAQLVAVVNQYRNAAGDQALTYEGVKR